MKYNCAAAKADIGLSLELLTKVGVVRSPVYPELLSAMVSPCQPCTKDAKKDCTGWRVDIRPEQPIEFALTTYRNRPVRVELSARCSFQRSARQSDLEWETAPCAESSVAVVIFVDDEDQPAERHHLDFAEPGQAGPMWHLQAGGNPPGYDKFKTTWLKVPRWPMPPADFLLVAEIIVMNLYESEWRELRENGQWTHLVQRSEDLLLACYERHLTRYLNQGQAGQRVGTWLDMQGEDTWPCRAS